MAEQQLLRQPKEQRQALLLRATSVLLVLGALIVAIVLGKHEIPSLLSKLADFVDRHSDLGLAVCTVLYIPWCVLSSFSLPAAGLSVHSIPIVRPGL